MSDIIGWSQLGVSVLSSVAGGFVGGWFVAYRLGQWRQRVEDRLGRAEERLTKGDRHVEAVPVLRERLDAILEAVRRLKTELRDDRQHFVTHEECNRRHAHDATS